MTTFSASLTKLAVHLFLSHDCSYYLSRQILAFSPLRLQKHTDLRAHDFVHSPDFWHQPRLASVTCVLCWRSCGINPAIYAALHEAMFQVPPLPWRRLLSSPPVWACAVATLGSQWGQATLQFAVTKYLMLVYGFALRYVRATNRNTVFHTYGFLIRDFLCAHIHRWTTHTYLKFTLRLISSFIEYRDKNVIYGFNEETNLKHIQYCRVHPELFLNKFSYLCYFLLWPACHQNQFLSRPCKNYLPLVWNVRTMPSALKRLFFFRMRIT